MDHTILQCHVPEHLPQILAQVFMFLIRIQIGKPPLSGMAYSEAAIALPALIGWDAVRWASSGRKWRPNYWTCRSYFSFEVATPREISCSCKSPTQAPPLRTPIADPDRCPGGINSNHIKSSVFGKIALASWSRCLERVVIPKYMPLESRKVFVAFYSAHAVLHDYIWNRILYDTVENLEPINQWGFSLPPAEPANPALNCSLLSKCSNCSILAGKMFMAISPWLVSNPGGWASLKSVIVCNIRSGPIPRPRLQEYLQIPRIRGILTAHSQFTTGLEGSAFHALHSRKKRRPVRTAKMKAATMPSAMKDRKTLFPLFLGLFQKNDKQPQQ